MVFCSRRDWELAAHPNYEPDGIRRRSGAGNRHVGAGHGDPHPALGIHRRQDGAVLSHWVFGCDDAHTYRYALVWSTAAWTHRRAGNRRDGFSPCRARSRTFAFHLGENTATIDDYGVLLYDAHDQPFR